MKGLRIGLGILIAAVALLGYLFLSSQSKNKELKSLLDGKIIELSDTKVKLDSIARELDEKIKEVESLGGDVSDLQNIKTQLEKDLANLKSSSNFSVKKYNEKIAEYESFLTEKDKELQKLKEENGMLASENLTLKTEKEEVISQNVSLAQAKDSLTSKVTEVSTQNVDLQNKVTLASALKAANVQVVGLTSKGKEKDGLLKTKKIDQLKVTYSLLTNPIAENGRREVYLRILDPNGGVLNDMSKGGVLNFNGREIGYSLKESVNYTNSDQQIVMYYKKDQNLISGVYNVELYAEGFKIGNGSFQIK